ncbi:FXYD domain-containing ion transport regulator 6 [Liparis tanakae]|uniref:FXYD domain-containing ion transport regulator n=1 Tax=Liparis tanakae TaxID=230148 RepID=A0A4Z2EJQ6_9TELE|nr:FXYD domain-containing ion transport regulator 6 [Liparis tanakae]
MSKVGALLLMTLVSLVAAEEQNMEEDPFTFDYHRLRVGGLILAAVLCLIGITILFNSEHNVHDIPEVSASSLTLCFLLQEEDRKQCPADALRTSVAYTTPTRPPHDPHTTPRVSGVHSAAAES